jgi:hypothetical protein
MAGAGTGECTYYRGPLERELILDRYHDRSWPPKSGRASWHVEHVADAPEALMHSRNDVQTALERDLAALTPEQRAVAIEYVHGPTTDVHRVDYTEVVAVIPEHGGRDVLTIQRHPVGSQIEYVTSSTAPKNSPLDNRYGKRAFPGGKQQITLLSYDADQVHQESRDLNQYYDLAERQT